MTRQHLPLALGVPTALLLAVTGTLDPVHALLLPTSALVAWHAWRSLDEPAPSAWPPPPTDEHHGARRDVTDLGWAALTRDGHVSARDTRRVTRLAADRLAPHGIDLADRAHHTAVATFLGPDVADQIRSRRPPAPRALHH
ncbi:hypothetical protein UQW22_14800 [Isoptericola halotolerans]|uniref:hypothetical protein n=1 Tax=Isoptericola halotolerans TaxID=300560 RepID=UPI0038902521